MIEIIIAISIVFSVVGYQIWRELKKILIELKKNRVPNQDLIELTTLQIEQNKTIIDQKKLMIDQNKLVIDQNKLIINQKERIG